MSNPISREQSSISFADDSVANLNHAEPQEISGGIADAPSRIEEPAEPNKVGPNGIATGTLAAIGGTAVIAGTTCGILAWTKKSWMWISAAVAALVAGIGAIALAIFCGVRK